MVLRGGEGAREKKETTSLTYAEQEKQTRVQFSHNHFSQHYLRTVLLEFLTILSRIIEITFYSSRFLNRIRLFALAVLKEKQTNVSNDTLNNIYLEPVKH